MQFFHLSTGGTTLHIGALGSLLDVAPQDLVGWGPKAMTFYGPTGPTCEQSFKEKNAQNFHFPVFHFFCQLVALHHVGVGLDGTTPHVCV